MKKSGQQSSQMGKQTKRALKLLTTHLAAHFDALPEDELARINQGIVHDLLGEEGPSYRPVPRDLRRSAIGSGILEIITHVSYLHHHMKMIKRNPWKAEIPDTDYINILAHSFDETCYIVHERMLKIFNLLKKMGCAPKKLIAVGEVVFKIEKKKGVDSTVFNRVLLVRGTHVHNSNVERPAVPRLGLLELFGNMREFKALVELERKSQLRASRAENTERFVRAIELVEFSVEKFFEAAFPALKQVFSAQPKKIKE
jgi:hypothetical protein